MGITYMSRSVRPPVGARKAQPYTIEELDAHPDADRIWATLIAAREELSPRRDDASEPGVSEFRKLY